MLSQSGPIELTGWITASGLLLLIASLAAGWIRKLPMTLFWLFLAAGIVAGPWGLGWLWGSTSANLDQLALASELALVVSLFLGGLKLRIPFGDIAWRAAWRLAFPAMLLCIGGICCAMHWMLEVPWALALLCGSLLAPTDPVLASLVAVRNASDQDALRGALSGEAGLNDGAALPFLVLALLFMNHGSGPSGDAIRHWLTIELLWSLAGGLAIGGGIGWLLGHLGTRNKSMNNDDGPGDFLALAIVLLSYGIASWLSASTFLAAFAAGVGLRRAEWAIVSRQAHTSKHSRGQQNARAPAELSVEQDKKPNEQLPPVESVGIVVADALSFGSTLERALAAGLVFVTGSLLANHWNWQAITMALLLFCLIRPISVYLATVRLDVPRPRRLVMGWLGIRGIGTINYLTYALTHGLRGDDAQMVSALAITTVVLSVILHGLSARPLMRWRRCRLEKAASR